MYALEHFSLGAGWFDTILNNPGSLPGCIEGCGSGQNSGPTRTFQYDFRYAPITQDAVLLISPQK